MDAAFIYSNLFTPVKNEFPSNRLTSHDVGPFSLQPPLSPVQFGPATELHPPRRHQPW